MTTHGVTPADVAGSAASPSGIADLIDDGFSERPLAEQLEVLVGVHDALAAELTATEG